MFEQLHTQLAAASYSATGVKIQAQGMVQRAADELSANGAILTADTGSSGTVAGSVLLAKQTVLAQALTATFSGQQKSQALGKLDQLGAQLASLGLT